MAINQPSDEEVIDPELEKAQKSMGSRIDPDPTPKPAEPEAPKVPEEAPKAPEVPDKAEEQQPVIPETVKPEVAKEPEIPARPEKYIPMPQYMDEKKQWKADKEAKEALELRVKELESLKAAPESPKTDDKITAYAEKYGMEEDAVKDLLALLPKGESIPAETLKKIEEYDQKIKTQVEQEYFETEFTTKAVPSLKKLYPNATDEQIAKAKVVIDQIAHSKEYHTQKIGAVILDNTDQLDAIFIQQNADKPAETKRTHESGRPGAGKPVTMTAKDFSDGKNFDALNDMDPADVRSLVKDFDTRTYQNYVAWVASQQSGVEVTRNGRKITLK